MALFPITMMSQVCIINRIKGLHRDHDVDVAAICRSREAVQACKEGLKDSCHNFYPLEPMNPEYKRLARKFYGMIHLLGFYLLGLHKNYFVQNSGKIHRQIMELVDRNKYDIVHVEYWYLGNIFNRLPGGTFKAISSHALVEENREAYERTAGSWIVKRFHSRMYKKSIRLQHRSHGAADLAIAISRRGREIIQEKCPGTPTFYLPIGMDVTHFSSYPTAPEQNTLIFYGAMGNQQNSHAFNRLWKKVFPLIREKLPEVKLLVVGSNPPEHIRQLHDGQHVIVTGFVDDPREYLAKAAVLLLPLETSSGFRGRTVEVMAMGIPVIGTHNALDNIEMTNGQEGYITDDDCEMADAAVRLMGDKVLREKMSKACRFFVENRYTIEATAGKLSKFYGELD